ncbi:DNA primase, large subunit [Schizophyllum commune Loenen D]|nr:DNA primase, large subunit [Schizophyllum commune Loenen D]
MFRADRKQFDDKTNILEVDNKGLVNYPYRLSFYDKPPLFDVTLEEFEICALDRLRILAEIEACAARNRSWEETKTVIDNQCRKYMDLDSNTVSIDKRDAQRRRDQLGHFVLRLAFCRTEELRKRFVKAETTLFRVRYDTDKSDERRRFLNSRDFNWIEVSDTEKKQFRDELYASFHPPPKPNAKLSEQERKAEFEKEKYYKVRWTRVPDLVERRKVFLKKGWAYVPAIEQSSIVFQAFESHLLKDLEMTAKCLPNMNEDTRIVPLLDKLSQGFLAGVSSEWSNQTEGTTEGLTADMIDDIARKHYPACMRNMHINLRKDHHLKHFARLTYGLFLKVLGLSLEEAIVFWRKSFDRITDDKFNKEYRYNIRHSYGQEGKRANYPAKSCSQILTNDLDSAHGCPYRMFAPDNLQSTLLTMYSGQGLASHHLPEIMELVKKHSYHVACTRVFEITHGMKKGDGIGEGESVTHPNQYAARSMELEKAKKGEDSDAMAIG